MSEGDLGGARKPTDQSLAHSRMEERALARGWAMPQEKREEIAARLLEVISGPKKYRMRYVLSAAKALVAADLRQQELDIKKNESLVSLADAIDEALSAEDPAAPAEVP